MPAKNREKIQPLGPIFKTLCLQGNLTLFSTKLVLAHQAYIGGAPCWGWAWHGWGGLSGARPGTPSLAPTSFSTQISPIFINSSRFHQFFLINSDLFDEFGGDLVGKRGEILLFLTRYGGGASASISSMVVVVVLAYLVHSRPYSEN